MRRAALNLLVLITALALTGLLLEVSVRLVAPQQLIIIRPDIWRPDSVLGWSHRASVDAKINTGERTVAVITDSLGLRVGAAPRSAAALRILLLGDSFMEALQVEYEQSLAGLFEDRLPPLVGGGVLTWNAGVDGWDPNQYLLRGAALLDSADFDLILVTVYLGNDIVSSRVHRYEPLQPTLIRRLRLPMRMAWSEWISAVFYPLNDYLKQRSHVFILVKKRLDVLRMRLGLTAVYFPDEFRTSARASRAWDTTADIARDLADLAREHGTTALFVLIPTPFQVDEEMFRQYALGFDLDSTAVDLEQPNKLLKAAMTARHLNVIDPIEEFRTAHRKGVATYGRVDQHLTPAGHEVLYQAIAATVADLLLVRTR